MKSDEIGMQFSCQEGIPKEGFGASFYQLSVNKRKCSFNNSHIFIYLGGDHLPNSIIYGNRGE